MKSNEEMQFEMLSEKYYDTFGSNYPIGITEMLTFEEHITRIEEAIRTKTPVNEEYVDGMVY